MTLQLAVLKTFHAYGQIDDAAISTDAPDGEKHTYK
jgi:hypothetical protein